MLETLKDTRPLKDAFKTPLALHRGAPFWSWNGDLEKDELLRQIDVFAEMGIGGYHIHSRTGLGTEYLGEEFMDLVKACRDHGASKGMLTWLYDEDRWPSGAAGGLVTRDRALRKRHLLFTRTPYGAAAGGKAVNASGAQAGRQADGELLASYAVRLQAKRLASYRLLKEGETPGPDETCWHAYLEVAGDASWFNGQAYADTLNPAAIQRFIEVTHERYRQAVGDSFGSDVPAIFTDEPQFTHKRSLPFAESRQDAILPWTPDLEADVTRTYGDSMLAHLPEVFWDLPEGRPSLWRYRFHEWVAERFAASFADQIGAWCARNGIALTGHMMEEATLRSQTNALGDAMRSYRSMQIPGIDMLCDAMELNTAKQAQSAARQFGCPGVLSELYGVTGWQFDFEGHKRQGDWQAALGVLFRVHHLSWYCMRGEAKRDYPASIHYQSPWWRQYPVIEDHFARVGAVLSRGRAVCRIGVLHPVESYWLCAGPGDTSGVQRSLREERFTNLTEWLLQGMLDFDFIAESLLPGQRDSSDGATFGVGEMQYEVVIVPGNLTLRRTTLERLQAFADAGGRVLFVGEVPGLVDAEPSDEANALAARCERVAFERVPLLESLARHRDVGFITRAAARPRSLLYQMRAEGDDRTVFVCNTHAGRLDGEVAGRLSVRGEYKVEALETSTGVMTALAADYADGQTVLEARLFPADHLLLRLSPGRRAQGAGLLPPARTEAGRLASPAPVSLDEPNVLLFDQSEFSINGGAWQPETPLLDVENRLRAELGLPAKEGQIAQPWVDQSPVTELATIRLRAAFTACVEVAGARLALENPAESRVFLDGVAVPMDATGYFTDKAVATIDLPAFAAGEHVVEIELSFTRKTSIEWFYLLGDFGVTLRGDRGVVTAPVRSLSFGDWTAQGLPFYGGNVTYRCTASADASAVQLPQFRGTAVEIRSQGRSTLVYRPPYVAELDVKAGEPVELTVYGHRANCFGPVHLTEAISWLGPQSYRTRGSLYSAEYNLQPLGLMSGPILQADPAR